MDYEAFFSKELEGLREEGRYRVFAELERQVGSFPKATRYDGDATSEVTVWCSNDYLGMGQQPEGLGGDARSAHEMRRWRWRAPAIFPAPITTMCCLERELADLHGKEAALLFTSGYVSNWAALGTLAKRLPDCAVFSDASNHASMIEGIGTAAPITMSLSTTTRRIWTGSCARSIPRAEAGRL